MDWVVSDELSYTLGNVAGWVSAGAMIIGGVIPYIPQYRQINKTQNSEGFSLYVCLALLVANTLRIFFWFGKRFEYPLLIQSIIMNITMFIMIHLCIRVKNANRQARAKIISDFDHEHFWAWSSFRPYVLCMVAFTFVSGIVMFSMLEIIWFVELVGFCAVFTEAMLGVPQLLKNYKSHSTVGMSVTMVIMWTCGDIFKTLYFWVREAPMQFWICGTIQVAVDIAILLQVYCYRIIPDPKRPIVHRVD